VRFFVGILQLAESIQNRSACFSVAAATKSGRATDAKLTANLEIEVDFEI
jgi:hypothetical protein